jgi:hypothetical protein
VAGGRGDLAPVLKRGGLSRNGNRRVGFNQPQQNTTSLVNKLATILYISTALLFHPNAKAWSGAGHQVIAAEAYRQLSPPLEKKVTEILKAHPDYEKWDNPVSGTDRVTTVESPEGYTKAAKMVAEKQPASAGYRLAAQSLFRPVHFLAQDMLSGIPCRKLSTKPTEPGVDLSPPCWLL